MAIFTFPFQYAPVLRNVNISPEKKIDWFIQLKYPIFTAMSTTAVSETGLTVNFTLTNATTYKVLGGTVSSGNFDLTWVSDTQPTGSTAKVHAITGLTCETEYHWKVEQNNVAPIVPNQQVFTSGVQSSTVTQNTIGTTTDCPISACEPAISITDISTPESDITHKSAKIKFKIDGITSFIVEYKKYTDTVWVFKFSGTQIGDKENTLTGLAVNTHYHWRIVQENIGDGVIECIKTSFTTQPADTQMNFTTLNCIEITTIPQIMFPLSNTIIIQNTPVEIKWELQNGSGTEYSVYIGIDGSTGVTPSGFEYIIPPNKTYTYIFTQQKSYTIQIGVKNTCTSTEILSDIVTISASNITPCIPITGTLQFVSPVPSENNETEDIIELNSPYTIRWSTPVAGTGKKYDLYVEDIKINSLPLTVNSLDYTFTIPQNYTIKVNCYNACTLPANILEQTMLLRFTNFTDEETTELQVICTYGEQPGTQVESEYLPLYGQDVSPLQSQSGNRIRIPTSSTSIQTSYERWFQVKVNKLKANKKLMNFKLYCTSNYPSDGCTIYYKSQISYVTPVNYSTTNWQSANDNTFSLLQEEDLNVNMYINGSQINEISSEDQSTDYGIICVEVTREQVAQSDFYLFVQYDELDV